MFGHAQFWYEHLGDSDKVEHVKAAKAKAEEDARKQREAAHAEEAAKVAKRKADEAQLAMALRRATSTRTYSDLLILERAINVADAAGVDADKMRVAREVLAKKGVKGGRQGDWNSASSGFARWYETDVKFR